MDIADDIAYSTYDLEDAFKAQFLTPLSITGLPEDVRTKAIDTIRKRLERYYKHLPPRARRFDDAELLNTLLTIFAAVYQDSAASIENLDEVEPFAAAFVATDAAFALAMELVSSGYSRTKLTSDLVASFIAGIEIEPNEAYQPMNRPSSSWRFGRPSRRARIKRSLPRTLKNILGEPSQRWLRPA
jgi:dGTPase